MSTKGFQLFDLISLAWDWTAEKNFEQYRPIVEFMIPAEIVTRADQAQLVKFCAEEIIRQYPSLVKVKDDINNHVSQLREQMGSVVQISQLTLESIPGDLLR